MANSNRIIEHFSQVKSERMGIDLQVIKYHRLNPVWEDERQTVS